MTEGWTDDMNDATPDWIAEHMEDSDREWWAAWDDEHPPTDGEEAASRWWWWVITGASVVVAAFVGFALCK